MAKVRSGVAQKWGTNSAQASSYYQQGVQNPRADWASSATAAAANQAAAIQKAIQEKRYEKGIAKAGSQKWLKGATEKGVSRFQTGVQAAQSDYETAMQPFIQTIESTTLPPRYPKGDPRNIQRVTAMADALRKKKLSM